MDWKELTTHPLLIQNYTLLQDIGILDYIENLKRDKKELEELMSEAYTIFRKESVDEIISFLVKCLSDKFIPSNLVFVLNEGLVVNRVKSITFKNLKKVEFDIGIKTLEPYETFFNKYPGTISYHIMEYDILDEKLIKPFRDLNAEIVVPIKGLSGLYGVIIFGPKILEKEYSPREIAYIDKLMKFISIGFQNTIHYEHSVKDSKTDLYNHAFFISRVKEEIARAKRSKTLFSLLIMDIDNFKRFNDTYGHLAGDEVIIQIAQLLKREFRESDIISRFGGEEFTILFPNTGHRISASLAERIRSSVENLKISYKGETLRVTISLGISNYNWVENIDSNGILKRADDALYESKSNGRNRVTTYKYGLLHKASLIKGPPNETPNNLH